MKSGAVLAIAAGLLTASFRVPAKASVLGSLGGVLGNPADLASILVDNATLPTTGDVFGSTSDDNENEGDGYQHQAVYVPLDPGSIIASAGDVFGSPGGNVYPVDPSYVDGENDDEDGDDNRSYASRGARTSSDFPRAIFGAAIPDYGVSVRNELRSPSDDGDNENDGQSGGNDD